MYRRQSEMEVKDGPKQALHRAVRSYQRSTANPTFKSYPSSQLVDEDQAMVEYTTPRFGCAGLGQQRIS
jgi:hypothetical protein